MPPLKVASPRALAKPRPDHNIYAYCHVRTNQVLYSLTRTLQPTHLKQLACAGANNNPPELRKDEWKPLWILQMPATRTGSLQANAAFQALREWRLAHEYCWKSPELLRRARSSDHVAQLTKQIEKKGGSKREVAYDVISKQKSKLRARMVMDQKANSIADLSAVLQQQLDNAARLGDLYRRRMQKEDKDIRLLALAFQRVGVRKLASKMEKLKEKLSLAKVKTRKASLQNDLTKVTMEIQRTLFAATAHFRQYPTQAPELQKLIARDGMTRKLLGKEEFDYGLKKLLLDPPKQGFLEEASSKMSTDPAMDLEQPQTSRSEESLSFEEPPGSGQESAQEPELTQDPDSAQEERSTKEQKAEPEQASISEEKRVIEEQLKPRAPLLQFPQSLRASQRHASKFTLDGVIVSWANVLDAEYAAAWPEAVQHAAMGPARHITPDPEESRRPIYEPRSRKYPTTPKQTSRIIVEKLSRELFRRNTGKEPLTSDSSTSAGEQTAPGLPAIN